MNIYILDTPVEYSKSMKWFEDLKQKPISSKEQIFIFEHNNIYTAGKSAVEKTNMINNTPLIQTNRGGLLTWHGNGQVMIYFIYNLLIRKQNLTDWFNIFEPIIINIITAEINNNNYIVYADKQNRGFWVKNNNTNQISKIGFIGLHITKGFLTHGISINYNNDLSYFKYINPCGLGDVKITSIQEITTKTLNIQRFKISIKNKLENYFKQQ